MNNYYTIRNVSEFLAKELTGLEVSEIFSQEKDKMCIAAGTGDGSKTIKTIKTIEYSCQRRSPYIVLRENYSKARRNSVNIFKDVYDLIINDVSLSDSDRKILITLTDGYSILFTFFSNKSNCFLLRNDIIVSAFKDSEIFSGKEVSETAPEKNSGIQPAPSDISRYLKSRYQKSGRLYITEALFRSGLSSSSPAEPESISSADTAMNSLINEITSPMYILYQKDEDFIISLAKLSHLKEYTAKEFENINELILAYLRLSSSSVKFHDAKNNRLSELKKNITHNKKKLESFRLNLEHSRNSGNFKEYGNLILQNIHLISKGQTVLKAGNDFGGSDNFEIKLKEDLSPAENAALYFDKYKRLKNSESLILKKISDLEKNITALESELATVEASDNYKKIIKEDKLMQESKNDETNKFRKFILNDKYQVWVGKDSVSNDLLTTKYASQNDLWFHVRGASGSHTILKKNSKEDVPKEIIHTAASISAYYSKARNAGSVPVAYCEKKYVKKKKGFKSGTVIMEREKVIFVKPSLPPDP